MWGDRPCDVDLGNGHQLWFTGWHPDRELNPQYAHVADCDRYGGIIEFADGCHSAITFDSPTARVIEPNRPVWTVDEWEPLTLSPSILLRNVVPGDEEKHPGYEHHGYIRGGRWEEC